MAYHQAPQDLPEVVSSPGFYRQGPQDFPEVVPSPPVYRQVPQDLPEVVHRPPISRKPVPQNIPEVVPTSPVYQPPANYRKPGEYEYAQPREIVPPGHGFPRDVTSRALPNYKPPSLRWLFLGAIIAILLGYIALTEYAIQTLPGQSGKGLISDYSELGRKLDASPSDVPTAVPVSFFLVPKV